jgi:hypothetical protein
MHLPGTNQAFFSGAESALYMAAAGIEVRCTSTIPSSVIKGMDAQTETADILSKVLIP